LQGKDFLGCSAGDDSAGVEDVQAVAVAGGQVQVVYRHDGGECEGDGGECEGDGGECEGEVFPILLTPI
jgi:hypothetical protein